MLRYPATYGHNSFTFNDHLNPDGSQDQPNIQDSVILDGRDMPIADFREGREGLHLAQGGTLGRSHKGLLYIPLRGRIVVPNLTQQAKLADRERAMRAAFDPSLCYRDSPATEGAYPFDFTEPTLDTSNFTNGRMPLRYYARPVGFPRIGETWREGTARPYSLTLVAADPRVYGQTERSRVVTVATPPDPLFPLTNLGTTPAPLKLTCVMTGAGAANFGVSFTGMSERFALNLTGTVNGDVIVVVLETCGPYGRGRRVTKNGVDAFSLKTSTPATWPSVPVGISTWDCVNMTNMASATFNWYDAWA